MMSTNEQVPEAPPPSSDQLLPSPIPLRPPAVEESPPPPRPPRKTVSPDQTKSSSSSSSSSTPPAVAPIDTDSSSGSDDDLREYANIERTRKNDVLCGRGVTTNRHPGNEKFRALVHQNKVGSRRSFLFCAALLGLVADQPSWTADF